MLMVVTASPLANAVVIAIANVTGPTVTAAELQHTRVSKRVSEGQPLTCDKVGNFNHRVP